MFFELAPLLALISSATAIQRCLELEPSAANLALSSQLQESARTNSSLVRLAAEATIDVNVYFHVLTDGSTGSLTEAELDAQLSAFNDAYASMGVSFTLLDTDYTDNADWFEMTYGSSAETAMKTALRKGSYADLNVYFGLPYDAGFELLGYCTFPEPDVTDAVLVQDGCYVSYKSIPGGEAPYDEGDTLTHEAGHWFNLYHTFQGESCSGEGDYVDDTPCESEPRYECVETYDSCPSAAGLDPIHNYMDYTEDACMNEFTAGQETRLFASWDELRASYAT